MEEVDRVMGVITRIKRLCGKNLAMGWGGSLTRNRMDVKVKCVWDYREGYRQSNATEGP